MLDVLVLTCERILENWFLFFRSLFFLILNPSFPRNFPGFFFLKNYAVMTLMIESNCTKYSHNCGCPISGITRPGWMELESTLSKGRCPFQHQGCWKERSLPIKTIIWFYEPVLTANMTDRHAGETSPGLKHHHVCFAIFVRVNSSSYGTFLATEMSKQFTEYRELSI